MWVPIIHFNGIASPSHHHHLARGTQFPMACVHWWKHNKGHQIKSSVPKSAVVITRIAYRRSETVREIPKKGKKQKCLYINIHRLKSSYEREERNFWLNKICERITTLTHRSSKLTVTENLGDGIFGERTRYSRTRR